MFAGGMAENRTLFCPGGQEGCNCQVVFDMWFCMSRHVRSKHCVNLVVSLQITEVEFAAGQRSWKSL